MRLALVLLARLLFLLWIGYFGLVTPIAIYVAITALRWGLENTVEYIETALFTTSMFLVGVLGWRSTRRWLVLRPAGSQSDVASANPDGNA